jgi:hypothetical protein
MVPESVRPGGFVRCLPLPCLQVLVRWLARLFGLSPRAALAVFRPRRLPRISRWIRHRLPEADFSPWGAIAVCQVRGKVGTLVTLDLSAQDAGTLVTAGYPMPSRLASCWGTAGADG